MFLSAMTTVQKILGESNEWSDIKFSEHSRYGVLSAFNTINKLKCHFRFGTGVVVRNSEVIKCLFEAQPVCVYFNGILHEISNNFIFNFIDFRPPNSYLCATFDARNAIERKRFAEKVQWLHRYVNGYFLFPSDQKVTIRLQFASCNG